MRVKVILNPFADNGHARHVESAIADEFRRHGDADIFLTDEPGHGRALAAAAPEEGYDVVVAAGGDGTVHEVVNGLVRADRSVLPMGVVPLGSGNDLAFGLDLPTDLPDAVTRVFTGQTRRIDLGHITADTGRAEYFENNLGIGFDAVIVIRTKAHTRIQGFAKYMTAVLQTIATYTQVPYFEMRFDDEVVNQKAMFLTLGNGPRHGGGFLLTPDARFDDELIDSCLVDPVNRATMIYMLARVVNGTHITSRYVTMRQNRRLSVRSDLPLPIHIDGEMFAYPEDNVHAVTIRSVPLALEVIV